MLTYAPVDLVVSTRQEVVEKVLSEALRLCSAFVRAGLCTVHLPGGDRISAGVEHQWSIVGVIHGQYFTDKDDVVSPFIEERGATLQARRTPGQQWDFACLLFEGEPGEFVCSARSEAVSELFVVRGENMDWPVLSRR